MLDTVTVVIDGNSIAYRAFYAVPPLMVGDTYTGVIHLFVSIIDKIRSKKDISDIIVVFDAKGKNHRHALFEEYKATRQAMPDDLIIQMDIIKEIIPLMGIEQYVIDGYEADDIINTLAKDIDGKVYIVTKDKDLHQLIDDRIYVYDDQKDLVIDRDKVYEKFQLYPEQIQDMLALSGDTSDNIPGVKGVGIVTARKLLESYGSVDNIYNNIDEISGKLKDKLVDGKEMAYLSKTLVQLIYIENFKRIKSESNNTKLAEIFKRYELKKHLNKLIDSDSNIQLQVQDELEYLIEEEPTEPLVTIFYDNKIYVADKRSFIESDITTISTKYVYDIKSIAKLLDFSHGYDIDRIDILLVSYLLNADEGGLTPKKSELIDIFFTRIVAAIDDIDKKLKSSPDTEKLYYELELPVAFILAKMEKIGILVEPSKISELETMLKIKIDVVARDIIATVNRDLNINSSKQLAAYLYHELNLKRRDTHSESTDVDKLHDLKELNPEYADFIDKILKYREYNKILSTYTTTLLDFIKQDKRIHTSFKQTGTSTGRLSSIQPNMQNIPVSGEFASTIRSAFIAGAGYKFVSFDYSQIELRILAHLSKDRALLEAFNDNLDIHSITARSIFNLSDTEEITDIQRRTSKAVNFGILYGQSAFGLSKEIGINQGEASNFIKKYYSTYSSVKKFTESIVERAREDGYCETILKRKRYIHGLNDRNHSVRNRASRMALNAPIQGSAADIIKLAMITTDKYINDNNLDARSILQIHDELIFEVNEDIISKFEEDVKSIMQSVVVLDLPLTVNSYVGSNWGEL